MPPTGAVNRAQLSLLSRASLRRRMDLDKFRRPVVRTRSAVMRRVLSSASATCGGESLNWAPSTERSFEGEFFAGAEKDDES